MGLRPRFKSQLKCPVALGPVVMLGPPPSGPTEEQRWWSWGPLLQSPPEGIYRRPVKREDNPSSPQRQSKLSRIQGSNEDYGKEKMT